ncbi:MAG: xanthine dehydrogenase family protein molybdopterin-binding subunit [Deltaproteobacteria bacterium]|nr:xanthine dehydrogenase family protein molybdopterin-binding subunit [Deltaproteobacteria bacterium]
MTRVIGRPTPRVEGLEKVTGTAKYAVDVTLPGMLWGKVARSPVPYARIKRVDISQALKVPGVKTVITGKDVAGMRIGRRIYDMPLLADDIVRFIGEKVAAVAAESEEAAEQAVDRIEVEYEELEPLLDPLTALQPSAPLLHPAVTSYRGLPEKIATPSNLFIHMTWGKGDLEEGFRQSDVVVQNRFETQVVHQAYLEPHACVVRTDPSGGAEIWSCSKTPFAVREQLANSLILPKEKLLFHPIHIGGDFGGKGGFMDVPVCYLLSQKSARPVKIVMEYGEELAAGNPRHASIINVKTGVKRDGEILAHHMEFVFDSGAYGAMKPVGYLTGAETSAGPYRIANCLIEEKLVYTNKVPCGHMRAPGDQQGCFATESQLDIVARKLRMDPADFKRKNLLRNGDKSPVGHAVEHIQALEALDKALALSGYKKPKAKNIGRGLAFCEWSSRGGEGTVFVKIDARGKVTVSSPVVEQGAGVFTVICEVVGEELGIPAALIELERLDSSSVENDTGVGGSRATQVYGNAAYKAGVRAREELVKIAAKHFGVEPRELSLANGFVVHRRTRRRMSFAEAAKLNQSGIEVKGYHQQAGNPRDNSIAAQVAEVYVDSETGKVELRKFVSAQTTGRVINPLMHQGQIDGGIVCGIGYALTEHLMFEDGKVATGNLGEYKIPTIRDVPPLKTVVLETVARGPGPYNSLSVGEATNLPVAAAIANAIDDAIGVRIKDLPITAAKLYAALNRNGAGGDRPRARDVLRDELS